MADKHDGLELIIGEAKKDPRFSKMKGGDEEPEAKDESEEGDGLDAVFSKSQADAIRAAIKASCS